MSSATTCNARYDILINPFMLGNATGSVAIQWTGEVTNTLSNWPTLIWFNNFSGSTQYIDSDATNFGTRFYRAVTP